MARIDTLGNFLTDVADAIREKKKTTDNISAVSFDTEIRNLPSGGGSEELEACYLSLLDSSKGINITKLPEGLDSIRSYAFYNLSSFNIDSLPNTITSFGESVFYECTNLTIKSIPDKITQIPTYCFYRCKNLLLESLPEGITNIGYGAFISCVAMTISKLPDALETLASMSFSSCENITISEIPVGVTRILSSCFSGCKKITELTFKGDITKIDSSAFYSTSLTKIAFPNITTVPSIETSSFGNTPIDKGEGYIYFPDTLVEAAKAATNWSKYAGQIKGVSEL